MLLLVFLEAALSLSAQDVVTRDKALRDVFDSLDKSLRDKDEAVFQARWHAGGFEKNLAGGSGLSGKEVFDQGSRKKWFPKPDLSKAQALGDGTAVLIPCEIWAREKDKGVDRVDFLLIQTKEGWRVLGGGEKRAQVEALASRWLKKEPLDPPKE